jgi:O-methyltransferase
LTVSKHPEGSNAIAYRPGVAARIARHVLPWMQSVLPNAVYMKFYRSAYATYQWVLHKIHAVGLGATFVFGDRTAKARAALVWKTLPYTMGGVKALENAFELTRRVEERGVPGALVECGVARGGASAIMALTSQIFGTVRRTKWLFDSYEGMPEATAEDYVGEKRGEFIRSLDKGECLGTIEEVGKLMFDELGFEKDEVYLVKGWFQDSVPTHRDQINEIAILRLDGDWYESTKIPLDNFYDKISVGGFVIVDDYATCFGSRRAVDEFMATRNITAPLNEDGRGGVWFEKLKAD